MFISTYSLDMPYVSRTMVIPHPGTTVIPHPLAIERLCSNYKILSSPAAKITLERRSYGKEEGSNE
jgi:hypothetical protein